MSKQFIKKQLKEWGVFVAIILTLYFTGLHTDVAAFAQRVVLATGVANPNIPDNDDIKEKASYNFSLEGLDGENLDFRSLKGKTVFINLWATWCAPCIAEMPSIHNLYETYADNEDLVFVMIALENDKQKVKKFIDKKEYKFPVYFPINSQIPKVYKSQSIPTTFVLDSKGYIDYKKIGMANYNSGSFNRYMEKLLNKD